MLLVNATIQGKLGRGTYGINVVSGGDTNNLHKAPSGLSKMQGNNIQKVRATHSKLVRGIIAKGMISTTSTTARMAKEASPAQVETGMGNNLAITF